MKEKKTFIRNLLLRYGVIIGIFWVIKYLFLIGSGFTDHVFIYIYYVLNIGTFLLIYIYYFQLSKTTHRLWQCIKMMSVICLIGSAIEGIVIFLHFQVIHPEYFVEKVTFLPRMLIDTISENGNDYSWLETIVGTKSFYIITNIIGKILLGIFLTLIISLLVPNKRKQTKE